MNANSRCKPLLLSMALGAALLVTVPAFAQSTGDDAAVIAEASVPQDRLVDRYSELAGSDAAAADLISDLRTGGDFSVTQDVTTTVTNPDGTTTTTTAPVITTIANPNGAMGWGEVNITLSLAQALLGSGAATDLQSALTGATTTVTNPDGTTTTTTTAGGVLAMRADGMGWGQIAKELGFNLGTLVSAGNRNAKATDAATAKGERAEKAKAERTAGKPDRVARAERPSRPEKLDRPAKPDRPERPAKPERGGR